MVPLIILLLVLVLVVFPLWALIRIISLGSQNESLDRKIAHLNVELQRLRDAVSAAPKSSEPAPSRPAEPAPLPAPAPLVAPSVEKVSDLPIERPAVPARPVAEPLPVPPPIPSVVEPQFARGRIPMPAPTPAPAPVPVAHEPSFSERAETFASNINWEQFMGTKLFAWLGGLAAFLGVAFFVKYSFEQGWISKELRAAFGFLFGLGLVVGGLAFNRKRHAVTAQSLIATGIVSLYAVTFACNGIYKFPVFVDHAILPFALMSLITVTAFLLAVRLDAHVIAILGMLGGFLTPELLSTGRDNPPGLFGYIALLDLGLIAVALHRRWHYLVSLAAAGTVIIQIGWAEKFLNADKAPTAMVVCLVFCALFLAGYFAARRIVGGATEEETGEKFFAPVNFAWSAVAFPFVAFGFAVAFLGYGTVAARPGLLFTFVLAADACLLVLAWYDEMLPKLHLFAGLAVFALLAAWTGSRLTTELLPWALAFYLVHAALHTAFPLLLERHRPAAAPTWWSQLFPPLTLLLMLGPLFKLDAISLVFWPCVLMIDLIAIVLALFTASIAGVVAVLLLTLMATGVWIFQVPVSLAATPSLLLVVGGFAVVFFAAGIFLVRQLGGRLANGTNELSPVFGDVRAQIPAFSSLLPFVLLIMMTQRLPFANPSPVFGLALLLVALTLGLAVVLAIEWLPACALVGAAALEYAWRTQHFRPENAPIALTWYVVFYAVFSAFPFVFRQKFAAKTGPWAIAALTGVVQFPLVYHLIERVRPNDMMGVLPALFALPPLAALIAILRREPADAGARLNQLAWFGGVALFFITLIFPIQFERQWITIGWALEGAALLWLFHRVPHPALRATGVVLLATAFARLALNPAVLTYHTRSSTPIWNWYLYSYGLVTAALFTGARLLAPPRERTLGVNARVLLISLGIVLAFLLLNVEIADYFTPPGARTLTFEFSGNFARDMTYTIAWALFALGLLLVSFWKKLRAGRYASWALLGVVLVKLYIHDLSRIGDLYRVGVLVAVAFIAFVASYAYERFLPSDGNSTPKEPK